MVLASGLTLFALTACSSDEPEEHAECRQGDMREEACGLYGTSIQRQVCGPRFRWINDGPCVDKAVCEHNETQTELCGGYNGNAFRTKTCTLGQWPENWSRIAAGGSYTRALNRADAFVYWGGASSDQTVPGYNVGSTMTTLASFSAEELSVGRAHTCALTSGPRELFCWGYNESGQLGDKTTASKSEPTKIAGPEGSAWSAISAGGQHTCAMNNYGWFYCWGAGNKGQLGNSAWTGSTEPVRIAQSLSLTKIVAGDSHTCAIAAYSDNYRLYCWGDNGEGQLGVGGFSSKWSPTAVSGDMAWNQVALGASHTCAITGSGHLYCWGANDKGQLGLADPSVVQKDSPQRVGTNDDWRAIRAGGDHTCGLRGGSGGNDPAFLYCWGANEAGQAGQSGSPKVFAPAALPTD